MRSMEFKIIQYGKPTKCDICSSRDAATPYCEFDDDKKLSTSVNIQVPMFYYDCEKCISFYADDSSMFMNEFVYEALLDYVEKFE